MDAGRLAQVLGNLIANATEHGVGGVDVRTSRPAGAVRIEIRNRNRPRELDDAGASRAAGRGRGLAIAERAARELGGRLRVESAGGETRAELELPAVEGGGVGSPVGAGWESTAVAAAPGQQRRPGESTAAAAGPDAVRLPPAPIPARRPPAAAPLAPHEAAAAARASTSFPRRRERWARGFAGP